MRQIALDFLVQKFRGQDSIPDLESWYKELQNKHPEKLFPYLVEPAGKISEVYVITPDSSDTSMVSLISREVTAKVAEFLPFMRPSGSQSAQVGPVIKRTYAKKEPGPKKKILETTFLFFKEEARKGKSWSPYFQEIIDILQRPKIRLSDQTIIDWCSKGYSSLLEAAVDKIGEKRQTVFLTVTDNQSKFPGERMEYMEYLMTEKLAGERYVTKAIPPHENAVCPLCGVMAQRVFPNAVKGAGINFGNMDREGAFSGISTVHAWKGFSLCRFCADLIYIYKFHVLNPDSVTNKRRFVTSVAGEKALIVPYLSPSASERSYLLQKVEDYVRDAHKDLEETEETLLDELKEQKAVINLNFLWVDLGQNIEALRGIINDVPRSRLRVLSSFNAEMNNSCHPVFPEVTLKELGFSLSLNGLKPLFKHPGGKKAQKENEGKRVWDIRRDIAIAVFHGKEFPKVRFWKEIITTARGFVAEVLLTGTPCGILEEGVGKKGPFLTAAGWVKYLAKWLHYFRKLGVMKMPEIFYQPEIPELKQFFGVESGINTQEKAFAFLIGILFGKLLQVQGARRVNVGSNALTWLKRLTLEGRDLPELYVKIRAKLIAYESEKSMEIRNLIEEIGRLGTKLGEKIDLDETSTCYFLLLGQSLVSKVLPKKTDNGSKGEENE